MDEDYLTPIEVAAILDTTTGLLSNWRSAEVGPPYCKPRGRVYYPASELKKWIERRDAA